MGAFIDLTGRPFGKWIVESQAPNRNGLVRWFCKCKCGNITSVLAQTLLRGASTKCRECKYHDNKENLPSRIWEQIKWNAKTRALEFSLTKQLLWELYQRQNGKCALSGLLIGFANTSSEHTNGKTTASLDRIDSTIGYLPTNVQWVHKEINRMKGQLSDAEFKKLCSLVVQKEAGA